MMKHFTVKVRTSASSTTFTALATSSGNAFANAANFFGDIPCSITVLPGRPL